MAYVFERQPKEGAKAFAAFWVYLGLGEERTLAKAAEQLGKSVPLLKAWSRRWNWAARVAAYKAHLATVEREAAEAFVRLKRADWAVRQEEQREEEWAVRTKALELAKRMMRRWEETEDKCGTVEGIARLLDVVSKLGRLASAMPLDHTEVTAEADLKLDLEWRTALERAYGSFVDPEEVVAGTAPIDGASVPASRCSDNPPLQAPGK